MRFCASVSRSLPATRWRFSYRRSTLPNCEMSLTAVFSPTPGTPGILSMESPIRARRSGICSGATPHFSFTAASSNTTRCPVRASSDSTRTFGPTSWSMSLSAVTSTTSTGRSRARSTSVPRTSSASKPGTSRSGSRRASNSRLTYGIWLLRSSGIPGRVLLVGGEALFPERRARRIPRDRKVLRALLSQELPQHGGHAEDRMAGLAPPVREIRQGVVGAVEIAGPVQHEQALAHRGTTRS